MSFMLIEMERSKSTCFHCLISQDEQAEGGRALKKRMNFAIVCFSVGRKSWFHTRVSFSHRSVFQRRLCVVGYALPEFLFQIHSSKHDHNGRNSGWLDFEDDVDDDDGLLCRTRDSTSSSDGNDELEDGDGEDADFEDDEDDAGEVDGEDSEEGSGVALPVINAEIACRCQPIKSLAA